MKPDSCRFSLILLLLLMIPAHSQATPTFQEAFDKHSAIMLMIDPKNGAITDANPAAVKFYGFSRARLRAMTIQQINTFSRKQVEEERNLAASEGRNFFIFRHKLASGEIRTVEVRTAPLDFDGRTLVYSIIRDISEERKAADSLWHYQTRLEELVAQKTKEAEAFNRTVIQLMVVALVTLIILIISLIVSLNKTRKTKQELADAERSHREVIWGTNAGTWEWNIETGETVFNRRWADIVGYRLEELEPIDINTWMKLCHPDDLKRSQAELERIFSRESDHYQCEIRMRHKNGGWVWVLDRGNIVEWAADGKPLRMSGTHQDVTDRKLDEEELRRHRDNLEGLVAERTLEVEEKAEELSRALEQEKEYSLLQQRFVSLVSHELRTPLAIIDSAAQRLMRKRNTITPEQVGEHVKKVRLAVKRLIGLINITLYTSRLDAGKIEFSPASHNLQHVVRELLDRYTEIAPSHVFNSDINGLPEEIDIDRDLIEMVINNLFSNAVKYSPENTAIQVRGRVENGCAILTVADSGIGIPKDDMNNMFKRFFRAKTAEGYRGTGIGLNISKEFVEMHGGDIRVESIEGNGTTFTVRLPIAQPEQKRPSHSLRDHGGEPIPVLVADAQ